ncbi:RHS repeat-associated core domain-containing protein [Massilia sp. YIM B02443]|uniref:RHS repeat-associated core domain-containing protein n=1 Tax=Massilia sp. YIM B02443 TaxID=3050127 RepID=UPI0025B648C3|nr:RHS repeat-associated core domain-containing protein [Massilia sp. YIM B02443]
MTRFQGQYLDSETGLHYNRHRYYDPDTAKYLTQDSIRLVGGINFYHTPRTQRYGLIFLRWRRTWRSVQTNRLWKLLP